MPMFAEGSWAVFRLADGTLRLLQLKNERVDLGRVGYINGNQLIGKPCGLYWQILANGLCSQLSGAELEAILNPPLVQEEEEEKDNRDLHDTNTSQQLSMAEIEALKQKGGDHVVKELVASSNSFALKNSYSQQKYVVRKQKKFLKWFCAENASVRMLCNYFTSRDARRIL